MPYKDVDKQRAAERESQLRRRQAQREAREVDLEGEDQVPDFVGRPQVEDAEVAYGDQARESVISKAINRRYGKSRTWACIMYEDSAPPDWEDLLRQIGVGFAVSPLHDKDVTQTGEIKKSHWHVILDWRFGSTTYRAAAGIARDVLHGTIPIPLVSPRGYYRYMTHLDNPDKAQYDPAKIVTGNGFDVGDFLDLTMQEEIEVMEHVVRDLIIGLGIVEYSTLCLYCMDHESLAVRAYVINHTLFFRSFLSSIRHAGTSSTPLPSNIDDNLADTP